MAQQQSTTTRPGRQAVEVEQPSTINLFLHAGWWQAACPTCGYVLVEHRRQATVERLAARMSCPVCSE